MAAFLVNGPPPPPLMAVTAAFYEDPTNLGEDEMDQDHFNELDKIFDLPYSAEQDPFTSTNGNNNNNNNNTIATNNGLAQQQHHHHQLPPQSHQHQHQYHHHHLQHGGNGMDWHVKEEDASYHTAVDASCHIDASYHHVDASGHSMIDASTHSTVMDASGHESLVDYSQHGSEGYDYGATTNGKIEPRFMEHSCEACKRSKKRCNRRNPCQICTSRGIKCVPQIRGPGRPPGSKSQRGGSSSSSVSSMPPSSSGSRRSESRGASGSHTPSSLSRSVSGNALAQQQQQQQEQQQEDPVTVIRLRTPPPRDPWHCRFFFEAARHCKEAFMKAWHDNQLDTAKCMLLRNMWAKETTRFSSGVDMTFGISEALHEAVGPPPSPGGPAASSPATRSKSHAVQLARELTHPGSKDGMGIWCLPEELRKLDDGCSMLCAFMHMNDDFFVHTDDKFSNTFMSRDEIMTKVESFAVLPILLLAEIFHPDDLPDVYAAIGGYWFRRKGPNDSDIHSQEASWICKCVDKRSNEFLAMVRFRSFVAPPDGYPGAALLAIRPLQQSKYLCDPDNLPPSHPPPSRLLRDTFGALPTTSEHGDDTMFRPLRRGMTVLSAETSGPQAVPGQQQQQHEEEGSGVSLHGGAPHQVGMSWSGLGITERLGMTQQYQSLHQQPQQQGQGGAQWVETSSNAFDVSRNTGVTGTHDAFRGANKNVSASNKKGGQVVPAAQLTQAQLFLLQGGMISNDQQQQQSSKEQEQQQRSLLSSAPATAVPANHVSPDGLAVEEEDSGSVATDFEHYGSSPSPEPLLLSHSRSSPALIHPRHRLQTQISDESAPCGAGPGISGLSHSSSVTDLDMSCHGPQDPNGYGGLQWTPAPLNHLIGSIGGKGTGVAGSGDDSTSRSSGASAGEGTGGNQSPAKQKRKMTRTTSSSTTSSSSGRASVAAGDLARSL